MTDPQPTELQVVVGWLPGITGGSLARGSKGLAPAVLYGDRVTVICPQSDDALEMEDYFDLREAVPDTVKFDALDSMYAELDALGQPIEDEAGHYTWQPYASQVWSNLGVRYLDEVRASLGAGDQAAAQRSLSKTAVLLDWGRPGDQRIVEALDKAVAELPKTELLSAVANRAIVREEVTADWMLGAFTEVGAGPGCYPLLDDPQGLLSPGSLTQASAALDRYARTRGTEAALSAAVLRTLPSPGVGTNWSELADVRRELHLPLHRFRAAMAQLSIEADVDPLSPEFHDAAAQVLRAKVWPALAELEELVREASLRRVFFAHVTGDLSAYAGPLLGLATAASGTLPGLVSAAVGVAAPVVSTLGSRREKSRVVRRHEYFFVREADRRLRRT